MHIALNMYFMYVLHLPYMQCYVHLLWVQPVLKAKLADPRYNIAMENHEFGVAPEAFTKWIVLNDTYDILSTTKDRYAAYFGL